MRRYIKYSFAKNTRRIHLSILPPVSKMGQLGRSLNLESQIERERRTPQALALRASQSWREWLIQRAAAAESDLIMEKKKGGEARLRQSPIHSNGIISPVSCEPPCRMAVRI